MKKIFVTLILMSASFSMAQSGLQKDYEAIEEKVIEWRRDIHQNPEFLDKVMGKFFTALFKIIFFSITLNKKEKEKYKYRFLGIYSAIMGHTSYFRDNLK